MKTLFFFLAAFALAILSQPIQLDYQTESYQFTLDPPQFQPPQYINQNGDNQTPPQYYQDGDKQGPPRHDNQNGDNQGPPQHDNQNGDNQGLPQHDNQNGNNQGPPQQNGDNQSPPQHDNQVPNGEKSSEEAIVNKVATQKRKISFVRVF